MITKKHTAIVTLAVCAIGLAALGSAKNPVERPFKIRGDVTLVVSLPSGDTLLYEFGEATHMGRYTNQASGNLWTVAFSGTATAADGDQQFWVLPGSSSDVEWTGGTGRFQNISGGFNVTSQSTPVETYPDEYTMVMTYTYTGVGTVTY